MDDKVNEEKRKWREATVEPLLERRPERRPRFVTPSGQFMMALSRRSTG